MSGLQKFACENHHAAWSALHVVSNHEKKVARCLGQRGCECYLPLYTEVSRWSDRSVTLEKPLFPGYVFARFKSEQRVNVCTVPGVLRLLGDERRGTVSPEEIERIRTALASGCKLRPHPHVDDGYRVLVREGPFWGVEGRVKELRNQMKVVVSLTRLEGCFCVELTLADIEVLAQAEGNFQRKTRSAVTGGSHVRSGENGFSGES
jgi:transcriptional antiterminator NusG